MTEGGSYEPSRETAAQTRCVSSPLRFAALVIAGPARAQANNPNLASSRTRGDTGADVRAVAGRLAAVGDIDPGVVRADRGSGRALTPLALVSTLPFEPFPCAVLGPLHAQRVSDCRADVVRRSSATHPVKTLAWRCRSRRRRHRCSKRASASVWLRSTRCWTRAWTSRWPAGTGSAERHGGHPPCDRRADPRRRRAAAWKGSRCLRRARVTGSRQVRAAR
jgi:hypothetical protein